MLPTFNEAKNVTALHGTLESLLEPALGDRFELIVMRRDARARAA